VKTVDRTSVQSTTIKSVGHDPKTLTLEIEFQSGDVYQYLDVPPAVYAEFMRATSIGTFLNTAIKCRYRYVKIQSGLASRPD
jgi:KTSC domain